ncbi:hypothetical protein CRM22_009553 [Opisthorchis felineus]|uniref:Uncharacterized protein n=1 Tax=Opisthorchis felineus TaxID=147828 RepID=A0A4V3SCY5_OPIFE|nr:hypothetical protein CRM22_009553 [Opisthorchis felineus]
MGTVVFHSSRQVFTVHRLNSFIVSNFFPIEVLSIGSVLRDPLNTDPYRHHHHHHHHHRQHDINVQHRCFAAVQQLLTRGRNLPQSGIFARF